MTTGSGFETILPDEAATVRLGAALGRLLGPGDVVFLSGGLGTGKTTLARAVIRGLAEPDEEVPSPTFTLVQTYETKKGLMLWHFDLYRLERAEEVLELDLEDAFTDGASLIEWPERLGPYAPPERLEITLSLAPDAGQPDAGGSPTARRVRIEGRGRWADRVDAARDALDEVRHDP